MISVCVAGWYYKKECLIPLSDIKKVHIVAHGDGDPCEIPRTIIDNIGLEFHCYDHYVKHIWDQISDVLFCHDDIRINDISFLEDLDKECGDVIMVWHDDQHRKRNLAHGRMFKCSAEYLSNSGGFWFDKDNLGCLNASKGCNHGIEKLYQSVKLVMTHFYTNKVEMGFRGKI